MRAAPIPKEGEPHNGLVSQCGRDTSTPENGVLPTWVQTGDVTLERNTVTVFPNIPVTEEREG